MPVPSSETVSRFEDAFSGCKIIADNLEGRLDDARAALQEIEQQIDAIRLAGAVPTEEDLDKARDRRQQGWGLVRKAWLQGENVENESRAYDPEHDLAEAYEVSVAQADETADRLRREAARVAEYAALLVQEKKITEEIVKLEADRRKAEQSLALNNEEWKARGHPPALSP